VGNVVPDHRALARHVTYACHEALQLLFKRPALAVGAYRASLAPASPRQKGGGNPNPAL
jgi:hypothetical protein